MNPALMPAFAALKNAGCQPRQSGKEIRAICPACGGKNRSKLAVGLGRRDGIVVHCFAGCGGIEILDALGLRPPLPERLAGGSRSSAWMDARTALWGLGEDALFLLTAAAMIRQGEALGEGDHARLIETTARISRAVKLAGVSHA